MTSDKKSCLWYANVFCDVRCLSFQLAEAVLGLSKSCIAQLSRVFGPELH